MNRNELFKRNHKLFAIFMREVFRKPKLVDLVPDKAEIIFIPENDPQLLEENLKTAKNLRSQGKKSTLLRVRSIVENPTDSNPLIEVVSIY